MRKLTALAIKDLQLLFSDRVGFFFVFFFPILMAVLFGSIYGGESDGVRTFRIYVTDADESEQSEAFLAELEAAEELEVVRAGRDEAREAARKGRAPAYVVLEPGFGVAYDRLFWGEAPEVTIGVDPSRQAEAGMLEGVLMRQASERFERMFADPSFMYDQADEALQALRAAPGERTGFLGSLETFLGSVKQFAEEQEANEGAPQPADGDGEEEAGPAMELLSVDRESVQRESETSGLENAYQVTFPQGVMWGIIGCTAAFGISLVTERVRGSLLRLRMSSLSPAQILGGKALACFVTTLSVAIGLFVLGAVVFGVRPASYGLLALAIVCTCLCFVGIMMLLSVLGKTEQAAGGIGWAVLMILAMFGGAMVPLFIMPGWMKMLSRFSPMYWAILSMEGAVWRGFGLGEMLLPCGVLLGCGAVCFVAGWRAFRWLG